MNLDDPFYCGFRYLPGDSVETGDGKGFRIVDTTHLGNDHTSWMTLQEVQQAERVALLRLIQLYGKDGLREAVARMRRQKPPRIVLEGKEFGAPSPIANPVLNLLSSLLTEQRPGRNHRQWSGSWAEFSSLGVFTALYDLYSHDAEYVARLWNRLWQKKNSLPHVMEALLFARLLSSGLDVFSLPEQVSRSPDFCLRTSLGPIHLEHKSILPNDCSERNDVLGLLHKRVVEIVSRYRVPMAIGVRSSSQPRKAHLNIYLETIDTIGKQLSDPRTREPVEVKQVDGCSFTGVRIGRDSTSNLPAGYGLKFEVPLIHHGFDVVRTLYQAGWFLADDRQIDLAFASCFDFPDESWAGSRIEDDLSDAKAQISGHGSGFAVLRLPFAGRSRAEIETRIRSTLISVRSWLDRSCTDSLLGVIVSFTVVECICENGNRDSLEAIRLVDRNERLLTKSSPLSRLSEPETVALARVFPTIDVRVLSLDPTLGKSINQSRAKRPGK